jgi:hypothetical protein
VTRRILRYPLEPRDEQILLLPEGAQILDAQWQQIALCVWALVDPEETRVDDRQIVIVGTGETVPEGDLRFIATVQEPGSVPFVWHVFEVTA